MTFPSPAAPRDRPWVDSPATPRAPHPGAGGPWRRSPGIRWGKLTFLVDATY